MPSLSVEPVSRSLLEKNTNNLLSQFDTQLKIVEDRYLAFFQERRRIEETYIHSLRKLYRKARTADASFDPRAEPTTTRAAWDNVRDSLEREADTQQAFVDILDNDVIKRLIKLKGLSKETRKRIDGNLKECAVRYAEYAEKNVSRPQAYYFRRQENIQGADLPKSEYVSDDDCRSAVFTLNELRSCRIENLREGYDCLEELVFTPTIKDVLLGYMNGMITSRTRYDELAKRTKAKVERALAGRDTSDLRGSLRRAFSFSIPPLTLYRNYRTNTYPELGPDSIFGVPLQDLETNEDNVPKVMRMCIEEVEQRGLDTHKIYSSRMGSNQEVLTLRHRFESEGAISFSPVDNIHSVGILLMLYLRELPEPLFVLPLQDCRKYAQNRIKYPEDSFSLLQKKIRELHPVQKASLGALLQHLLRVASHSDTNSMTVEALIWKFCDIVLGANAVQRSNVFVKKAVLRDLIQNANTLFDEHLPHVPPPNVAEIT